MTTENTGPPTVDDRPDGGVSHRLGDLAAAVAAPDSPASRQIVVDTLALALSAHPAVRWASITHLDGRPAVTVGATDDDAQVLDELQYRAGEGPCLTAIKDGVVVVSDFASDDRWPAFTGLATTTVGARSALSMPLADLGHPTLSLNLYADAARAFGADVPVGVRLVAAEIALVLTALRNREKADQMQDALMSNRRVGAAIGILMHRHRWGHDEAFSALKTVSQNTNRKLRDVAEDVLLTGELRLPPPRERSGRDATPLGG